MGFKLLGAQYSDLIAAQQTQLQSPVIRGPLVIVMSVMQRQLPYKANLVMWIDCSDTSTITKTGTAVTAINDKSISGYNWSGTATWLNPGQAGLGILTFTVLQGMKNTHTWSGDLSIIACTQWTASGGSNGRVLVAAASNWLMGYFVNKHPGIYLGGSAYYLSPTLTDTNFHIHSAWIQSGAWSFWEDAGLVASGGSGDGATDPDGLSVNADSSAAEPSYNALAEVLVYAERLTDSNRSLVEQYLKTKWAIP